MLEFYRIYGESYISLIGLNRGYVQEVHTSRLAGYIPRPGSLVESPRTAGRKLPKRLVKLCRPLPEPAR